MPERPKTARAIRAPEVNAPSGRVTAVLVLGLALSVLLGCQGLGMFKRPAAASQRGQVAAPDETSQGASRARGRSPAFVQDAPATVDELLDRSQPAVLLYDDPDWFLYEDRLYSIFAHNFGMQPGGKTYHFTTIKLTNNIGTRPQRLRLTLTMAPYAYELVRELELAPGEERQVAMTPTFELERLYGLRAPTPAQVRLTIESNLNPKSLIIDKPIIIEPPTRMRWRIPSEDGKRSYDMRAFTMMLVTPDDRGGEVQRLMREAAQYTKAGYFQGYAGATAQDVHDQMRAIYQALGARGYIYNSVATTYFDHTQRVRMPAEALKQNHGNCIDTSLVFASALESIGLEPHIVFITGHAFVAVSTKPNSDNYAMVEGTGIGHMPYDVASAHAGRAWERAKRDDPNYIMLNIKKGRQAGFYPVNL